MHYVDPIIKNMFRTLIYDKTDDLSKDSCKNLPEISVFLREISLFQRVLCLLPPFDQAQGRL